MGSSAFSARRRMAANYVLPAAGNSGRNGRGLIVGCLQQYQLTTYRFVRATSRAAWPHALHDMQQQQQQRGRSWKEQIGP